MYINQMYKYENNGTIYVGSTVPQGSTILETMDILNAEAGYNLIRILDNENVGVNIWLHNGDVKENYREEEQEE